MAVRPKPDARSGDHEAMRPYWDMVATIMGGAAAMRQAGEKYLPRFENESDTDYDRRRKTAKFTNIYRDIVENLAAKPFAKEVALVGDKASAAIKATVENIDGNGNHLSAFAATLFFAGINDAVTWVMVDKTPVPAGATLADELRIGARPYWVHVPATELLAVYSAMVDGREQIVHARILEPATVRDGFGERAVQRVRVLNREPLASGGYGPATYEVFEEQKSKSGAVEWVSIEAGPIAIGVIALVPFLTGRRIGTSWRIIPPLQDAAHLQVEHYQQETNLKSIKEQACFPMLAGNGIATPTDNAGQPTRVPVGPRAVLFAPPNSDGSHGQWNFIEPSASSLTFLAADVKATEQQLRELGRQPLTAQTGNLTVVTTAFAAQKGNSAVQAWALLLKDALENALAFTAMWLGDTSEPEVTVHKDFAIEMESDQAPTFLLALRDRGDISRLALIEEAKRRDILSPEYDPDADLDEILAETAGEDEDDAAAALPPDPNNPSPDNPAIQ